MEEKCRSANEEMDSYQREAMKTAVYSVGIKVFLDGQCSDSQQVSKLLKLNYCALGLNGEAGEVAEKVKKLFRNYGGEINEERKTELIKELGDVLWYIAALSSELGVRLSTVADLNLTKLQDRHKRNVIASEGDNR